jgi:phenylpropionate dioxygenase-like ring-hydroxylating dioxygenase large terminal subunit
MTTLADDQTVIQRILDHIDNKTTDLGEASWREPVAHYRSPERLEAELARVLRRHPIPFCPSAALAEPGAYVARDAARTPLLAVRGNDGQVRAFRNACRHRGTQIASGTGCEKAFVCPYHGWTYGLDGTLRHVPHEHGFLGLEKSERGLVPVTCVERNGVVFVSQDATVAVDDLLRDLPPLIAPEWRLFGATDGEVPANWKIFAESFLEGYHIRSTHSQTFYPVQFDNLNVVETFGRNSRIAYPYRAINKLRTRPREQWSVDGKLTYVYHLFPNALIATFPSNLFLVVLEPLAIDRTHVVTYVLGKPDAGAARPPRDEPLGDDVRPAQKRGLDLVDAGGAEDRAMVLSVQRGIASGANEFLEFGRFESAIVHFHRALDAAVDGTPWRGRA